MKLYFEWDLVKNKQNQSKHKNSFENAATVFRDPNAITIPDLEHSEQEERWVTLGLSSKGILLVVIHTFRTVSPSAAHVRIISCRKADKTEIKEYNNR
jgi:hypothetical protein